ncbi:MAG TPA: HepT-like ribonuclease domain-containing protein [Methylococcus sp.]|nr:HepT-like ribonuclease domain-containing protein [Methylococcus sp.]
MRLERLLDILEAIEAIERHLPETWEAFDGDELVRIWCLRHLEIIGEAAAKLSDETRGKAVIVSVESETAEIIRRRLFEWGDQHPPTIERPPMKFSSGGERHFQILGEVVPGFAFRDRRILRIAQMSVADRPISRRADVWMRAAGIVPWHAVKALEALVSVGRIM